MAFGATQMIGGPQKPILCVPGASCMWVDAQIDEVRPTPQPVFNNLQIAR
jgi:hypothetical protein